MEGTEMDNFFPSVEDDMPRKRSRKQTVRPGPQVYIGPSLPDGSLMRHTVFKNGLPPHVEQLKLQTPEVGRLIVPVTELSAARQRLARHGAEAKAFRTVVRKYLT